MKKLIKTNDFVFSSLVFIISCAVCIGILSIIKHQATERRYQRELTFAKNNDVVVEEGVRLDSNGHYGGINRATNVAPVVTDAATGELITDEPNEPWTRKPSMNPPMTFTTEEGKKDPTRGIDVAPNDDPGPGPDGNIPKYSTDFSSVEEYQMYMSDRYGLYND